MKNTPIRFDSADRRLTREQLFGKYVRWSRKHLDVYWAELRATDPPPGRRDWKAEFATYHPGRLWRWFRRHSATAQILVPLLLCFLIGTIVYQWRAGHYVVDILFVVGIFPAVALLIAAAGFLVTSLKWGLDSLGLLAPLEKSASRALEATAQFVERFFKIVLWTLAIIAVVVIAFALLGWLSGAMQKMSVPVAILIGALIIASAISSSKR